MHYKLVRENVGTTYADTLLVNEKYEPIMHTVHMESNYYFGGDLYGDTFKKQGYVNIDSIENIFKNEDGSLSIEYNGITGNSKDKITNLKVYSCNYDGVSNNVYHVLEIVDTQQITPELLPIIKTLALHDNNPVYESLTSVDLVEELISCNMPGDFYEINYHGYVKNNLYHIEADVLFS